MGAFALLMVLASRAMIQSGSSLVAEAATKPASLVKIGWNGFLVGLTTGFVGAGAGFLIIPALVILLKLPMKMAVGTSFAIIAANSLFGFAISANSQPLEWKVLVIITAIGAVGIFVGQAASASINEKALKKGFGYFVLLVSGDDSNLSVHRLDIGKFGDSTSIRTKDPHLRRVMLYPAELWSRGV